MAAADVSADSFTIAGTELSSRLLEAKKRAKPKGD